MSSVMYPVAVLLLCLGSGQAYPDGAPTSVCTSMTPGHGVESTTNNPYTLTASESRYTPGTPITVTISGSGFAGFLLQARAMGSTTPLGTFSNFPANTKGIICGSINSAATHSSTSTKPSGTTFTWTPNPGLTDEIEFVAAIAFAKTTWWLNTKSPSLSLASGGEGETTITATTGDSEGSTTTTTTTKATTTKARSDSPGQLTSSIIALCFAMVMSLVGWNSLLNY